MGWTPVVHAASFTANDPASLIAAINNANATPAFDIITLTGDINFLTTQNNTTGNNALPVITSSMRIDGDGFTISRDAGLPVCVFPPTVDHFRFFMVQSGALHLHNVTLSNGCNADNDGVAILAQPGTTLILTQVTAQNNTSLRNGGALATQGAIQIYDSVFTGNFSGAGGGGDGGAIIVAGSSAGLISGSRFDTNRTEGSLGGGAILSVSTLTIRNSTFSNNQANFIGNGGALHAFFANVTVENSTFNNNSTPRVGGAIFSNFSTVTISNSTLSANTAQFGGGIHIANNTMQLDNVTLVENGATNAGGGLSMTAGSLNVRNSIITGNAAPTGPNCNGAITGADNGSNTGECPGLTSTVNVGTDISATRATNGGVTQTHALLAGSSAENASGAGATTGDQRGAIATGVRDMGAYELAAFTAPTISFDAPPAITLESGGAVTITLTATSRVVGVIWLRLFDTIGTASQEADYPSFFDTVVFDCNANLCDVGSPLTVAAGVFPVQDALFELDETLFMNMVVDGTATGSGASKEVTIRDFAEVQVTSNIPNAVENPPTNGQFTVFLTTTVFPAGTVIPVTNATGANIEVIYTVSGTATSGVDFTPLTLTAIIPNGQSSVTIDVAPVADALIESNETVVATLVCICIPAGLNITVITTPATVTILDTPPATSGTAGSSASLFDPAISKLGFLLPGQAGVTGERIEWRVTVSNTGAVAGQNITVSDTLDNRLRIDSVSAPNATVTINGQAVTIVYAVLNVGEFVNISIFTTTLSGASVNNTACVSASNQGAAECATGSAVQQLPTTGETPLWRMWLIAAGLLMLAGGGFLWGAGSEAKKRWTT